MRFLGSQCLKNALAAGLRVIWIADRKQQKSLLNYNVYKIPERPLQDYSHSEYLKNIKCTLLQYKEVCYGSWQTSEDSSPLFQSAAIPKIRQYSVVQ